MISVNYNCSTSPLKLFARDDFLVDQQRNSPPRTGYFSYSRCFEWTFSVIFVLGLLAAAYGIVESINPEGLVQSGCPLVFGRMLPP